MLLKNKKTGEIGNLVYHGLEDERIWVWIDNISKPEYRYNSLAELNEEWEDMPDNTESNLKIYFSIDNDFNSREEAKKAVEKLKAWKRLKDKGFEFRWIDMQTGQIKYSLFLEKGQKFTRGDEDDLLLLFRGEE